MSSILADLVTDSKVTIETKTSDDDTIYVVKTPKGQFAVTGKGDGELIISSDIKTMSSAIGGRGDDDGKIAWFTDKHCKSNAEVASVIMELLIVISK